MSKHNDCQADVLTYSRLLKHEAYTRSEKRPFERFTKLLDNMHYELEDCQKRLDKSCRSTQRFTNSLHEVQERDGISS